MKIARVLWTVGLAIAVIVSLISAPKMIKELISPSRPAGDDQPVMMAGGSLYVGTSQPSGFRLGKKLKHAEFFLADHAVKTVYGAYVKPGNQSDAEEIVFDPKNYENKLIEINLRYCKSTGPSTYDEHMCDKTSLKTESVGSAQKFVVSTGRRFQPILPNLLVHARRNWLLTEMEIKNTTDNTSETFGCLPGTVKPGELEGSGCWLKIDYCDVKDGCGEAITLPSTPPK